MLHEGRSEEDVKQFLKDERHGSEWDVYRWLRSELRDKFDEYHKSGSNLASNDEIDVDSLAGEDFEVHVGRKLLGEGYEVTGTPRTGDQGADLIAKKLTKRIVIQVKRSSRPIGNNAVQEVLGALNFYRVDEAWVITNATFTPSAKALAQLSQVRLIDGHEFRRMGNRPDTGT